uniref:Reverse transcriptase Ty1/copia-type domain-containing protein n=1 Tax=Trichuris muris TaxID=70415 RepID=A0A5S6QL75_TRIMR
MTVYVQCTPVEAIVPRWGKKPLRAVMFAQGRLFRKRMKSRVAPPIVCHRKAAESIMAPPIYSRGSRLCEKSTKVTIGSLDCFLGIHIQRQTDGSVFVGQSGYCKRILKKFSMARASKVSAPCVKATEAEEGAQ